MDGLYQIWQGMFGGDERLKWYGLFCAVTLVALAYLYFISGLIMELYFALFLRKRFPEEWHALWQVRRELTTFGHYQKWVIANHREESPFYRLWIRQRRAGDVCMYVWMALILVVGLMVLADSAA